MLELESSVDAAKLLLASYDPGSRTWKHEKSGEFWDAVEFARQRGDQGAGRRVAVVDSGFDMGIPALAEQRHVWPTHNSARATHGSAVALLILEVAPQATLDLYPVGVGEQLDEDLVQRAVRAAADSGADVINLSLGEPFLTKDVFDFDLMFGSCVPWPDMTWADVPFWLADERRSSTDFREGIKPLPSTPLAEATGAALARECTIIAASGNQADHVFAPALFPGVLSASHIRVTRTLLPRGHEEAAATPPLGYSQSEWGDFSLLQPPSTLGSSFAAPLVSGFAALLPDRSTLAQHRDSGRLATNAKELEPLIDPKAEGSDRRQGVVVRLFNDAITAAPHAHWRLDDGDDEPCPECAAFSAFAYIEAGLYCLKTNQLAPAEELLSAAALFSPLNPHAAAGVAMVFAARAEERRVAGLQANMVAYLTKAEYAMRAATELRPGYKPYEVRRTEFAAALNEPENWRLVRSIRIEE